MKDMCNSKNGCKKKKKRKKRRKQRIIARIKRANNKYYQKNATRRGCVSEKQPTEVAFLFLSDVVFCHNNNGLI
jgi:hypothetical protein